jgi:hypothetical protein
MGPGFFAGILTGGPGGAIAGVSGPIVHGVHRHPLKAVASFFLEITGPALFISGELLFGDCLECHAQSRASVPLLVSGAVVSVAGAVVDVVVLANEDVPPPKAAARDAPTVTLLPLLGRAPPFPGVASSRSFLMGVGLGGQF